MTRKYARRPEAEIKATEPHVVALFRHMDKSQITLNEAAEKSGVDARVLSFWRTGVSRPRIDLFVAVCGAVGLSLTLATRGKSAKNTTVDQLELPL